MRSHVVQPDVLVRAVSARVGVTHPKGGCSHAQSFWRRSRKRSHRPRPTGGRRNYWLLAAYLACGAQHRLHEGRRRVARRGKEVALVFDAACFDVLEALLLEEVL